VYGQAAAIVRGQTSTLVSSHVNLFLFFVWIVVSGPQSGSQMTATDLLTLILTGAKSDIADALRIRAVPVA
jgi:hypothetical protein